MTGFSLKPQSSQSTSDVDFNAINKQVKSGNTPAVISVILDLGVQTPDLNVTEREKTVVPTQAEAEAIYAQMVEIKGQAELDKLKIAITETSEGFEISGKIVQPKDGQEVAIYADCPSSLIDYGEEIGTKPYRLCLNKTWMGNLKGISLKAVPPQVKGGVWTFAGNSILTKLANATGQSKIVDGSDKNALNDIGLLLGQPLMVDLVSVTKNENVYIQNKAVSSLPDMMKTLIDFSVVNPVGVTFDNATFELLDQVKPRGDVLKKIKAAKNYQGSAMQVAVQAYEASLNSGGSEATQAEASAATAADADDTPF